MFVYNFHCPDEHKIHLCRFHLDYSSRFGRFYCNNTRCTTCLYNIYICWNAFRTARLLSVPWCWVNGAGQTSTHTPFIQTNQLELIEHNR